MARRKAPFWKRKSLFDMTLAEWELLCDGCGKCCLYKLEDVDTQEVFYTRIACRYLELEHCRCMVYPQRRALMPTCMVLTPEVVMRISWLPETCAYRLLAEGKELPAWHPLISDDPRSVYVAGISVCGKVISEVGIDLEELDRYVI